MLNVGLTGMSAPKGQGFGVALFTAVTLVHYYNPNA